MKKRYGKMKYELTGFFKAEYQRQDEEYLKLHWEMCQESLINDL